MSSQVCDLPAALPPRLYPGFAWGGAALPSRYTPGCVGIAAVGRPHGVGERSK